VLESSHREALGLLGFTFSYGFDPRRPHRPSSPEITLFPAFMARGMLDYAESLMQGSPGLDHVRSFCLPVIDFLMAHFAELPQAVQWRLHALAPAVMETGGFGNALVEGAPVRHRAVPILKNVQLFVGATVLHRVPDTTMSLAPLFKGGRHHGLDRSDGPAVRKLEDADRRGRSRLPLAAATECALPLGGGR